MAEIVTYWLETRNPEDFKKIVEFGIEATKRHSLKDLGVWLKPNEDTGDGFYGRYFDVRENDLLWEDSSCYTKHLDIFELTAEIVREYPDIEMTLFESDAPNVVTEYVWDKDRWKESEIRVSDLNADNEEIEIIIDPETDEVKRILHTVEYLYQDSNWHGNMCAGRSAVETVIDKSSLRWIGGSKDIPDAVKISIPKTVERINPYALSDFVNIKEVEIKGYYTGIEWFSVDGKTREWLTDSTLVDKLKEGDGRIEIYRLQYKVINGIGIIPEGVTEIESDAFRGREDLEEIVIPSTIKKIGASAFRSCINLCKVTISEGVISIFPDAFRNCRSLSQIYIPSSVTEMEPERVFQECRFLEHISVDELNPKYDSRGGCNAIVESDTNTLVLGCNSTNIPDDVVTIGDSAFCNCPAMRDVHIPDSVVRIEGAAFAGCGALEGIFIPASVTVIEPDAFSGCVSLERISVAKENKVYDSRRYCNGIIETESGTLVLACRKTVIPQGVHHILNSAFDSCKNLTEITIPESVIELPDNIFLRIKNLSKVVLPRALTRIGGNAFAGCWSLKQINLSDSITEIHDGAFMECQDLSSMEIPKSVTVISDRLCKDCISLADVALSDRTEVIGREAFAGCISLERIVIPESVKEIKSGAFRGCLKLNEVIVPAGIFVADNAFEDCPVKIDTPVQYYDGNEPGHIDSGMIDSY